MKLIIAIIKSSKLDDVRDDLVDLGCFGMTVTEVKGFGKQQGHKEFYRGVEKIVEFRTKIKLELFVPDEQSNQVINAIREAAYTDSVGDGKIFVLPLEKVVRIRTGETNLDAL